MIRLFFAVWGFLLVFGSGAETWAASDKAMALRQANGLAVFTPSEKFLAGNFVADEINPGFIFGPVQAFVASRSCPATWLREEGAPKRPASLTNPDTPVEYTIILEEDCPEKVRYYVFLDQSGMTPQQWLEWRRQFHRSKADETFSAAKTKLEQACEKDCGVVGELRFIQQNGELVPRCPEEILRAELKIAPIFDLNQQKKISP